ncbi:MAG: hypothetical protein ACI4PP_03420 [Clostridia bacterium]
MLKISIGLRLFWSMKEKVKKEGGRFRPQERKETEKGKEICFKELPLIEEVSVFLMPERHGKMRNTN